MGKSAPLSVNSPEKNIREHGKHERCEIFFVCPVIFKGKTNLYDLSEIYFSLFIFFSSVSGPFQVRCKSVVGPFLRMGGKWMLSVG